MAERESRLRVVMLGSSSYEPFKWPRDRVLEAQESERRASWLARTTYPGVLGIKRAGRPRLAAFLPELQSK